MPELDDDALDGCELDFTLDPSSDEEIELLALFPDGVADDAKAAEWRAVGQAVADGGLTPPGYTPPPWSVS